MKPTTDKPPQAVNKTLNKIKMSKNIHNILAWMVNNDVNYEDLTGNGVELLKVEFNLTDKQLRGLIIQCYKNDYSAEFENNVCYIKKSI